MVVLKRGSGRTLHMWTSYVAAAYWASLAQTTQKTISFTTVAFFLLWLLSNVLISVLVLSLIPPRDCGRQSTACVYCCTHQSRPYYVKGKSWESLLIAYPSCTAAFWTEPHSGKYTVQPVRTAHWPRQCHLSQSLGNDLNPLAFYSAPWQHLNCVNC